MLSLSETLKQPVSSVIERENSTLERLMGECHNRVVLFGAGSLGRRTLAELRGIGIEPLCFSDNNRDRWASSIDGCPILSPADAAGRYGDDALFLVTIWNAAHWYVETEAQLRGTGCRYVSSYPPIYWRFAKTFIPFLLNDLPHKIYESSNDVLAAERLWSDQSSLDTYRALVYWYATGDGSSLPQRPPENSYFPKDIFSISNEEVLVDCGAYDGDTISQLINVAGNAFGAVYAVEADTLSLAELEQNLCAMPSEIRSKVHIRRCAVGAERTRVKFEVTGTVDSKICNEGGIEVDCIPIDELFSESPVTMIKMDIEGAEYGALLGGRNVIQRDQPILAVCVYHAQSDIWRIPLLAREMLPNHSLFLRAYEGDGFQTVMYAVPPR